MDQTNNSSEKIHALVLKLQEQYCEASFQMLWELTKPVIFYQIKKFNNLKMDYADLEQEAIILLQDTIKRYDSKYNATFLTYYNRAITNRFISLGRYTKAECRSSEYGELSLDASYHEDETLSMHEIISDRRASPEEICQLHEMLEHYLENLSPFERLCFITENQGFSKHEISKKYNSKQKSVINAASRCKTKFMDYLHE